MYIYEKAYIGPTKKLLQLVCFSGVDHYIYDHTWHSHEGLLSQLDQMKLFAQSEFFDMSSVQNTKLDKIIKFDEQTSYYKVNQTD